VSFRFDPQSGIHRDLARLGPARALEQVMAWLQDQDADALPEQEWGKLRALASWKVSLCGSTRARIVDMVYQPPWTDKSLGWDRTAEAGQASVVITVEEDPASTRPRAPLGSDRFAFRFTQHYSSTRDLCFLIGAALEESVDPVALASVNLAGVREKILGKWIRFKLTTIQPRGVDSGRPAGRPVEYRSFFSDSGRKFVPNIGGDETWPVEEPS
jgi:hypothetical protein